MGYRPNPSPNQEYQRPIGELGSLNSPDKLSGRSPSVLRTEQKSLANMMQQLPLRDVGSSRQMALEFAEQERRLTEEHRLEKQTLENALAEKERQRIQIIA